MDIHVAFYTQFLKCGNFATWLRMRTTEAQKGLRRRYLEVLCEGDIKRWMKGRHEVELVDLLVRVKDELVVIYLAENEKNGRQIFDIQAHRFHSPF